MTNLIDSYSRKIDYMRISITDRCDLRCVYCTSRFETMGHEDILRYEEIERIVQSAAMLGVKKIRLTGGEPLARLYVDNLIEMLTKIPGIEEVTMTTNGTRLAEQASILKKAGLSRVNISLDSLKPEKFAMITGRDKLTQVLDGIEAANNAGLVPVKINMVVIKGLNDDEVADFARRTVTHGWNVRYIEHMPFENLETSSNGQVSISEIRSAIEDEFGELKPHYIEKGNGPAKYYRIDDSTGTIGFIGAVSECFCEECNRFRLTADGKLRPCLLDDEEIDIKTPLRNGASIDELTALIKTAAAKKKRQHRLAEGVAPAARTMKQIGG